MTQGKDDPRLDPLMDQIRDWCSRIGGVTGELKLMKRYRDDGQWEIVLAESRPEITFIFVAGNDINQEEPWLSRNVSKTV